MMLLFLPRCHQTQNNTPFLLHLGYWVSPPKLHLKTVGLQAAFPVVRAERKKSEIPAYLGKRAIEIKLEKVFYWCFSLTCKKCGNTHIAARCTFLLLNFLSPPLLFIPAFTINVKTTSAIRLQSDISSFLWETVEYSVFFLIATLSLNQLCQYFSQRYLITDVHALVSLWMSNWKQEYRNATDKFQNAIKKTREDSVRGRSSWCI